MKYTNIRNILPIVFTILFTSHSSYTFAQSENPHKDWEDPQVIGVNKLPYHSTLQLPSKEAECKEIISLDGDWFFNWSKDPDSRPIDFYKADYDVNKWKSIKVPGNWQTQGFGTPIYTNINYPFKRDQPRVTSEPPQNWTAYENRNPVGSYVTTFVVTQEMMKHNVILHFGGVSSAMYVWVNGEKVGYSQNSMSPAEFDISKYIKGGINKLAVEVYRWSDGSYLENQDMWRLSGIFRSVQLWVRPLVHIADYHLTGELKMNTDKKTPNKAAPFAAKVKVCNAGKQLQQNIPVKVTIDGQEMKATITKLAAGDTTEVTLSTNINNVHAWSANDPYLYPIGIDVADEHFDNHFGFKQVEVVGEVLKINGKNVKLLGVNRHDHHPQTGRYVDRETYKKDISMMKLANINFLRTSHYPDDPYLYELCDKYGIFVMDEANNESHGYGIGNKEIGDNANWTKAHVDRAVSLVQRDKNHPCVVMWSLGNEAGAGCNPKAMREAIKKIDPKAVVFYDSDRSVSDIYDDGYLTPEKFRNEAKRISDRPFMMREYAHAMGNSMGNMKEYMDVIYADSSIAGVAIWDLVDQGLDITCANVNSNKNIKKYHDGTTRWLYGGDFGDNPNDGHFLINGLLNPDRTPHPHYFEVRYAYQPIHFSRNNGVVEKHSVDPFVSVDDFDYDEKTTTFEGQTYINVYAKLKEDKPWGNKGTVIAREQFIEGEYNYPKDLNFTKKTPKVKQESDYVKVSTTRGDVYFNVKNGDLTEIIIEEDTLLQAPVEPCFWKPANDNQLSNGYLKRLGDWKDCAQTRQLKSFDIKKGKGNVTLTYQFSLSVGAEYTLSYCVNDSCDIKVEADYKPLKDDIQPIPTFGMRTAIRCMPYDNGAQIEYLGRGPLENYPDRKSSQLIGLYSMSLSEYQTEYVHPQDNSNRCDVRVFATLSPLHTLQITGMQPMCVRANNYPTDELDKNPRHPGDVERDRLTIKYEGETYYSEVMHLNLGLNIHGVGGVDGWGAQTLPAYTNPGNKPYHFGFLITCH